MTSAKRFPVIEIQGSHFEAAKSDAIFVREKELWGEARRAMAEAVPPVRAAAPELLEEVEGIAAGTDLSFDEVFRLSCSAEMGQWQGCMEQRSAVSISDECTSFAARTQAGTLVAWNMDWYRMLLPYIVLLKGHPEGQPAFLAFALAGSVGRPGLSEHIAISANQLPYRPTETPPASGPEWAGPGVPYCFLSRMLLKQKSTSEALELLDRTRRMACLNYTLGDTTGDICCVETTPAAHAVLRSDESFVVHANSYHSPKFQGIPEPEREERDPRAHTARALLLQSGEPLDREAIAAVQTHHFPGETGGICVHLDFGGREAITLLSFVAAVGSGRIWAAYGPPCEHEFLPYQL